LIAATSTFFMAIIASNARFGSSPPAASAGVLPMLFRLVNAEYDSHTERAYVEFRANDGEGGEIIATTIFTFRSKSKLSKPQIRHEIVRKARHALKRASTATYVRRGVS
jgi:hypothetical protein